MKENLNYKDEYCDATPTHFQRSWPTATLFVGSLDDLTYLEDIQLTPFARPVVLVKKISGTVLAGSGAALMIGNLLLSCSCLLQGPASVLDMLVTLPVTIVR